MLGEFNLIDEIKKRFPTPDGVTGIGDDCAILPQHSDRETLVSTDMLMEGVHFLMDDVSPYDLGWKSAAVNVSDIAGMGGRPEGCFLSFALPKTLNDNWLLQFIDGFKALCDRFACPLLGGDTTSSLDRLCISVTVLGSSVKQLPGQAWTPGSARRRSDARSGDLICVTGNLGDSAAGLKAVLDSAGNSSASNCPSSSAAAILRERHYRPIPQVEAGLVLSATPEVHAMMDISDGIGSDLRHILKASEVSAEVDVNSIPLSKELIQFCSEQSTDDCDPLTFALDGGEDYQLLFTATPAAVEALKAKGLRFYVIGRITGACSACQLTWLNTDRDFHGFTHF